MNAQIKMIGVKKNKNNKGKMARYQKQARRGMKGFAIYWNDSNPFTEDGNISSDGVTHTNSTQRLIAREMWDRCKKWILNTEFTWEVRMVVIFDTPKRGEKPDEYIFRYTCTLRGKKSEDLNKAMKLALEKSIAGNDAYPVGHKNKGTYLHCEFVAQIVGI